MNASGARGSFARLAPSPGQSCPELQPNSASPWPLFSFQFSAFHLPLSAFSFPLLTPTGASATILPAMSESSASDFGHSGFGFPSASRFQLSAFSISAFHLVPSSMNRHRIKKQFPISALSLALLLTATPQPGREAIPQDQNLFVSDNTSDFHETVLRYSGNGTLLGNLGIGVPLNGPVGMAFDGTGNLYIANQGGNTILRYSNAGTCLGVFAVETVKAALSPSFTQLKQGVNESMSRFLNGPWKTPL